MLEKFKIFLEGVRVGLDEQAKSMIRVACEWPRAAYDNAHGVMALARIIELLPHRCLFDGCRYGLNDGNRLCKKPWRVQTD
eukprot:13398892-Heterocapsa_arctica.AAC.1